MRAFSLFFALLIFSANSFTRFHHHYSTRPLCSSSTNYNNNNNNNNNSTSPPGSFFNPIPPPQTTEELAKFADSLAQIGESQNTGMKVLGSGVSFSSSKTFVEVGPSGVHQASTTATESTSFQQTVARQNNDITKLETDAAGYTLYKDASGESKRVFEALVDYPSEFTLKIVGLNSPEFADDMVELCKKTAGQNVKQSTKINGKWCSVSVALLVESAEILYKLYAVIDADPRVKFKF